MCLVRRVLNITISNGLASAKKVFSFFFTIIFRLILVISKHIVTIIYVNYGYETAFYLLHNVILGFRGLKINII